MPQEALQNQLYCSPNLNSIQLSEGYLIQDICNKHCCITLFVKRCAAKFVHEIRSVVAMTNAVQKPKSDVTAAPLRGVLVAGVVVVGVLVAGAVVVAVPLAFTHFTVADGILCHQIGRLCTMVK